MKKQKLEQLTIVVLFLLSSNYLFAQEVFTCKPGVYLTFDDFLNNSPSEEVEPFNVVTETEQTISRMRNTGHHAVKGIQETLSVYRLRDKNEKKLKGSRDFWGFSDGYFIYINSTTHTKADHFVRVQIVGPICYFFQLGEESGLKKLEYYDPADIRQHYPATHPKIYYLDQFVFDIKTGQMFKLTKERLLQIVSPYPDLVEISKALNKKDVFIDIILMYNSKMKDEQN